MKTILLKFLVLILLSATVNLTLASEIQPKATPEAIMGFSLKSTAFTNRGRIPVPHTCLGADLSPPLKWENPPAGTKEYALIMDDPDAPKGTWVHWVLYKIPAKLDHLAQGIFKGDEVKHVGLQGKNDFGFNGYGGPCPPPGKDHRYFFKLYALSEPLPVKAGLTKAELLEIIRDKVLGEAQWVGVFSR